MASKQYQFSPFGTFDHPWVNKPDVKFNTDGVYKTGLVLSGPEAQAFKEKVDAASQAAFDTYFETGDGRTLKPGERRQWSIYVPYTEEMDDSGDNPTGYITFDFKQNAKIKLRDGTTKDIQVGIKDSKNKDLHKPVFSGSEGRTMFSFRDIPMKSLKQIGARMDLAAIQVTKLSSSNGPGFGEVEGGYSEDEQSEAHQETTGDTGGDF